MINGLDSARSLARRSIVNDLRWFLFILNSVSSEYFFFLFLSAFCCSHCFVSFRSPCDLTFAVWLVYANVESTWLFIHDQCQMQANELRLHETKRHRTDPKWFWHFCCCCSFSSFVSFLCVCSVRDASRLHDFYLETGRGERSREQKKLTKNSN